MYRIKLLLTFLFWQSCVHQMGFLHYFMTMKVMKELAIYMYMKYKTLSHMFIIHIPYDLVHYHKELFACMYLVLFHTILKENKEFLWHLVTMEVTKENFEEYENVHMLFHNRKAQHLMSKFAEKLGRKLVYVWHMRLYLWRQLVKKYCISNLVCPG